MTRASLLRTLLALIAALAFIGAVLLVDGSIPRGAPPLDLARGGPNATDTNPEAAEQADLTQERHDAYAAALAAGTFGKAEPIQYAPAVGWFGESVVDPTVDDWEPAIAADPHTNYVYALTTRYGVPEPCKGNCPSPVIELIVSADNGATWGPAAPLCACKGKGQFDPIIEVVPDTGAVYALFMIEFNVVFTKSLDHGRTWSAPVPTWGNVAWNDKPVLAVSHDGRDLYASWNGPTGGDPWVAQSHDYGATWTQTKVINSKTLLLRLRCRGRARRHRLLLRERPRLHRLGQGRQGQRSDRAHVFVSRDNGATWQDHLVATVQPGIPCLADGCTTDFYVGHTALSVDGSGNVVVLYDGATTDGGLQQIWTRHSTDHGMTWSSPVLLSTTGEQAGTPAAVATGNGDVRIWYYQTSGGGNVDAWNVWYRRSTDDGTTWSDPLRISDATSGAPYKTADGFAEIYGDYGEIAITSAGKSIAIWGEGINYTGPGGVWINRQQ